MNQITSIIDQAVGLIKVAVRLLLALIVLAVLAKIMGIRVPYLTVNDGNMQALAAFIAAAAFAMR